MPLGDLYVNRTGLADPATITVPVAKSDFSVIGWLKQIWASLTGTLTVTGTVAISGGVSTGDIGEDTDARVIDSTATANVVQSLKGLSYKSDLLLAALTSSATPTRISTNASTSAMGGPGVVKRFIVNAKGALANTMTVYDALSATGTAKFVFDTTLFLTGQVVEVNARFAVGCFVVIATGTAVDVVVVTQAD